jgi:hypothetical protein
MSHFTVAVIVTPAQFEENPIQSVTDVLAPFDENGEEKEPYEIPCSCVGTKANLAAYKQVEKETGQTWETVRNRFRLHVKDGDFVDTDARWQAFNAPFQALLKQAKEAHPKFNLPDPACEDCKGTGKNMVRWNKRGQWDWWSVGGRWNRFYEDQGIASYRDYEDTVLVDDVLALNPLPMTFAVLDSKGDWHEKGSMNWFGIVTDQKEEDAWTENYRKLLEAERGNIIILVDCHI